EDQGAYAVWARGRWQTTSDSPWTSGGIAQDVSAQNVIRFPSAENIRYSVSTLTWTKEGELLRVEMDLTSAVGQLWKRTVEWKPSWEELRIRDVFDSRAAEFGFEKPSADDDRAPYVSDAEAKVQRVSDGFRSVISW
ncbi:hypothetical protein Q6D67_18925, partial [Haliea sp. E1-2-M8]|uniref:hypothetical protein n=1 Tax=Haliea sp. E1-2-M8 TaxID=3064706 RepID=UPI002715AC13